MRTEVIKILLAITVLLLCVAQSHAQRFPERKFVRAGNTLYEQGNFAQSEVDYRRALEKSPGSYEAAFNLAGSLYKQERYPEASELYSKLAADSSYANSMASSMYNNGNAQLKQRQLEQAIESYKNSLRLNPNDQQAKFNLAYAKKLAQQDKDKDKNDDKNKDNKDNKDQQDQKQNQDNKDNKGDKEDKDGQPDKPKPDQNDGNPKQGGMSKQEADQMLEAMQQSEDKTREKVNEQKKTGAVGRSGKNW